MEGIIHIHKYSSVLGKIPNSFCGRCDNPWKMADDPYAATCKRCADSFRALFPRDIPEPSKLIEGFPAVSYPLNDRIWIAECPFLGVMARGMTREEAEDSLKRDVERESHRKPRPGSRFFAVHLK